MLKPVAVCARTSRLRSSPRTKYNRCCTQRVALLAVKEVAQSENMSETPPASNSQPQDPELQGYFKHLLEVLEICQDYNKSMGKRKSDYSAIWAATVFLRSIGVLNSTVFLIKVGAYDDAAIFIRTLFEIELQLSAIKAEPELAKRLVTDTEKHREKRLEAIGQRGNELPGGVTQEAVAAELAEIKAANIPGAIQKRQLAEKSKDPQLVYAYDTIYSLLSDIAHVSPMGLANYLQKDVSTGIIKLNPNTSLFSPGYLMALAAATQLNVLDLVAAILGDPSPTQKLRKENGAILSEINARGTI
jgi:Family of unknown function (DUF5677)